MNIIEKVLSDKYGDYLSALDIYENKASLKLSNIIVKIEYRNQGIGSKIIEELIAYADTNKQIVVLTPSSDYGSNKNRLIQYYKNFGFKKNAGQYKNFEFKEDMIRYPRAIRESVSLIKELLREGLLTEMATGKHLIVVDVQPEYENAFGNMSGKLFDYINKNHKSFSNLTFFYNGYDSLGMIQEGEYRDWLFEQGLDENIAYEATLYDKGYAFFRVCIDNSIDYDSIVNLVREMHQQDINDSRELDEEFWDSFIEKYGDEEIRELLEFSEDCLNLPDLMSVLENLNNIVLVGGGINECLHEVEIALDALGKNYNTWGEYTY